MSPQRQELPLQVRPWRILIVEDNPGDADLVQDILATEHLLVDHITSVATLAHAISELQRQLFDAIILDLGLPDGSGIECLRVIRATKRDVPIVVLTGVDDDRLAVACIAAGAHDYLRKGHARAQDLRRAVGFAVARAHELAERNRAYAFQVQLAAIVEASSDAIMTCSPNGSITTWNRGAEAILGYSRSEVLGRPWREFIRSHRDHELLQFPVVDKDAQLTVAAEPIAEKEIDCVTKHGTLVTLVSVISRLHDLQGFVVGFAVTMRDITDAKRREQELRARNAELVARNRQMRALTERLHSIREAERKRISHAVHDELGQMLTGVKMDLRWLQRHLEPIEVPEVAPICQRIAEVEQLVDSTLVTVQRIATELRPSVLDSIGLSSAIREEARRFEQRTSTTVAVSVYGSPEPGPDVATSLFRIFQELMTNVARHAQATHVVVDVGQYPDAWILRVADDGIGLPPEAVDSLSSLGLLVIRERAAAHGGTVSFVPGLPCGTQITVRIPHLPNHGDATSCATS